MPNNDFSRRRVVALLARNWSIILVTTLVLAVLAAGFRLLVLPNSYDADAMVLVTRPRYQIELESKFKSNQEPLGGAAGTNVASLRARLDTLAAIARTSEVEAAVQQRLADRLPADNLRPGYLTLRIRVRPANELLRITASAGDPVLAADLANAWAEQVASRVEVLYGASAGVRAIEAEVQNAYEAYSVADRAVSRFAIDYPVDDLARRLAARTEEVTLLQSIQDQRLGYLRSRALSVYGNVTAIDQVIRDAETLRLQLEYGTSSQAAMTGDGLALMMLRAHSALTPNMAVSNESAPVRAPAPALAAGAGAAQAPPALAPSTAPAPASAAVQIASGSFSFSGDRASDRIDDLTAMTRALRDRRDELQAQFEALAERLQTGADPASVVGLPADDPTEIALRLVTAEQRQLRAELGELTRQREELGKQRTLRETSYQTLLNKAQELRVLRATDDSGGVTVAERAVPARGPSGAGPLRFGMIGAATGLLLGCALALSPLIFGWLRKLYDGPLRPASGPEEERAARVAVP